MISLPLNRRPNALLIAIGLTIIVVGLIGVAIFAGFVLAHPACGCTSPASPAG